MDSNPASALVCSRAFSGFDLLELGNRLKGPLIKENGSWRKAKWDEAMKAAAEGLKKASGKSAAVIGSPRLTNEAQYLLQKIGRAALGTNNLGGPGIGGDLDTAARAFGFNASTAALEDIGKADLIIAALPDMEETYPSIAAEIRGAALRGAKVQVHSPVPTGLDTCASGILRAGFPGIYEVYLDWLRAALEKNGDKKIKGLRELTASLGKRKTGKLPAGVDAATAGRMCAELLAAKRPLIVADPALIPGGELAALADLLILIDKPHGLLLPRAGSNSQGAIDLGMDGAWLPGHLPVSDKAARAALEKLWGRKLPSWEGLGGPGIIGLARTGGLKSLLSWGDTGLDGLDLKGVFAVSGEWAPPSKQHPATVVFPAALFTEDTGTLTSVDRKVRQAGNWRPEGAPQPNWLVLSDLAKHLGLKGYETISALRREISSANKLYHG
ncbi:MAG: molybdopterin-dependent oxidoreductase, partial [Elusimicrobiota bacterium]|nr:molybdopterin-dependent oxidoreductase [Elusimicrobiota bacterium]